jgi:acetyl esterase/lipase
MIRYTSLAVAALFAAVPIARAEPIDLATYKALPRPAPTAVLSYGNMATQAVDVFRPEGVGPFPVVVLIHGGCWRDLPGAGREQLRHLGADLARRGIATWSIGYRRADETGGGYPGTFEDVATAVDRLRDDAARYDLDLTRTILLGHSAGGHLALWAAARHRLPAESPLRRAEPFPVGAARESAASSSSAASTSRGGSVPRRSEFTHPRSCRLRAVSTIVSASSAAPNTI